MENPHTGEMGHQMTLLRHDPNFLTSLYRCDGCGIHFLGHETQSHRLREEVLRLRWELERSRYLERVTRERELTQEDENLLRSMLDKK